MKNASNISKYKVLSKVYDRIFNKLLYKGRAKALSFLNFEEGQKVLLIGVGTGLDIPMIPEFCHITGVDLSESMLAVAKKKYKNRDVVFSRMNAEELTFKNAEYDIVILSLILSVVEDPSRALAEALRVTKSEGTLLIYDKFREDKISFGRKLLNIITSFVGTDINRSFYEIANGLHINIHQDVPVMYSDNYRAIVISKED